MNAEACKQIIQDCFPQIQIRSFKPNEEGWDFYVLEINGELIFRFPRRDDGEFDLKKEIALLPELAEVLPVRVPHYEFIWSGDGKYARFAGYRKIEGVPLTRDYFKSAQTKHLAQQLSVFLSELQRFPIPEAVRLNVARVSPAQWRQRYRDFYMRVRDQVFPLLESSARAKAALLWETFSTDEANFRFKPVLIHGDLSGGHILCDPSGDAIVGIIDWGDASIGDPALDFTGLLRVYGRDFAEQVLSGYQGQLDATFWQRVLFYSRIVPFHKILYGLNMNDAAPLKLGMEQLQKEMLNWK